MGEPGERTSGFDTGTIAIDLDGCVARHSSGALSSGVKTFRARPDQDAQHLPRPQHAQPSARSPRWPNGAIPSCLAIQPPPRDLHSLAETNPAETPPRKLHPAAIRILVKRRPVAKVAEAVVACTGFKLRARFDSWRSNHYKPLRGTGVSELGEGRSRRGVGTFKTLRCSG